MKPLRSFLPSRPGRSRAFTLIELMVVILILAILAALIVPKVVGRTGQAKVAKAQSDIATLSNSINTFRLDTGRYPSTEEGLQALRVAPGDVRNWNGPYLNNDVPLDPWSVPYIYEYPGSGGRESFRLGSLGADGQPGGEGEDADIFEGDQ